MIALPPDAEVPVLAAVVAAACAVPGVFLVLRKMALLSDAISHVVLLGIVAMYLVVRRLDSPWLFWGAALSGVVAVALVELLQKLPRLREDAAIGLTFPALFALGVILATLYAGNSHLDADAVLLGELALAPLSRWRGLGFDLPLSLVVMSAVLLANVAFVLLFWKELKLATFDTALAGLLGLLPGVIHYLLMGAVSATTVAAFDAVGSVLVVGLMIVPAATAHLLTDRLDRMVLLAVLIGMVGAVGGCFLAEATDTNYAGCIAATLGGLFSLAMLFAPEQGLLAKAWQHLGRRRALARQILAVHLLTHEGQPEEADECRLSELHEHLGWPPAEVLRVRGEAETAGWVQMDGESLRLTDAGRAAARAVVPGMGASL